MDKYENKVKIEEIRSLISEGAFEDAADVADTVNWPTVKNISAIGMASDLYKKLHRFEDSREVLLYAYDRQKSRPIVKSLCELSVELGDLVNGIEYFKEFVDIAPKDPARYILQYKLYRLQNISLEEQIEILEKLQEEEPTAKWAYELAELYHRAGLETKCVEECREIILWFVDGKYVIKAYELMAQHQPLTEQENYKYELLRQAGGELNIQYSLKDNEPEQDNENRELEIGSDVSPYNTQNLQAVIAEGLQDVFDAKTQNISLPPTMTYEEAVALDEARRATVNEQNTDSDLLVTQMYNPVIPEAPVGQELEMEDDRDIQTASQDVSNNKLKFSDTDIIGDVANAMAAEMLNDRMEGFRQNMSEEVVPTDVNNVAEVSQGIETYQKTEEPKHVSYEYQNPVIGNTGIIETFHKKSNMDDLLSQGSDGQISFVVPEEKPIEKQITGQISIEDVMQEWERKKKESEEKLVKEIKENLHAQTASLLRNFDEATKSTLLQQIEDAVISAALKEGVPKEIKVSDIGKIDKTEEIATEIIEQQLAKDEAKRKAEEAARKAKEAKIAAIKAEEAARIAALEAEHAETENIEEDDGIEEIEEIEEVEEAEELPTVGNAADNVETEEVDEQPEEQPEEKPVEEPKKAPQKKNAPKSKNTKAPVKAVTAATATAATTAAVTKAAATAANAVADDDEPLTETQAFRKEVDEIERAFEEFEKNGMLDDADEIDAGEVDTETENEYPENDESANTGEDAKSEENSSKEAQKNIKETFRKDMSSSRSLSKAELELFGAFVHHKSTQRQLADTLDNVTLAAYTGNILVTSEEDAEITAFSKMLIQDIQLCDNNFTGKVALISGEKLNHKDIEVSLGMVNNGAMIITGPQDLKKKTVQALLQALQKEGLGVVIILQGKPDVIDKIIENNEGMAETFNLRVDLKAFDDKTLVEYAKSYAYDHEYIIDEFGVLALHTRIDEMQTSDHEVTLSEVEEIVDEAIYYADKKTPAHFFDILLGKRYGEEDMIVLREKDFMHY